MKGKSLGTQFNTLVNHISVPESSLYGYGPQCKQDPTPASG